MPNIIFAGHLDFAPSGCEGWLAHAIDFAEEALKNPGCLDFVVAADPTVASRLFIFQRFESRAALEAHVATAPYAKFHAAVAEINVTNRNILEYEVASMSISIPRPSHPSPNSG
jgi:quinol monooxygenase YgiN